MPDRSARSSDSSKEAQAASWASRRRKRLRQTLIAIGATLVLVATVAGVGGALLVQRYEGSVGRDDLLDPHARSGRGVVDGPMNLLLIGSDKRSGNPDAGERSDTIIVAHLSKAKDKAYLISVPRDLLVDIPPMPSVNFAGEKDKINAAFEDGHGGVGGTRLVSATLSQLLGLQFNGAAVIDFSGFRSAVDILGGVKMCVETQVVSIHTGTVFEPGCRLMNSTDSLDYVRQRDFPDGDYARQRHQQQFLKAFLDRIRATGAVSNPVKMDSLVRAVAGTMTVDTGGAGLTDFVFTMRGVSPGGLVGVKIPSDEDVIDDVSYVVATADATSLFEAMRADTLDQWVAGHQEWVNKI
jgi:LCP family protein required for cell wall assembly